MKQRSSYQEGKASGLGVCLEKAACEVGRAGKVEDRSFPYLAGFCSGEIGSLSIWAVWPWLIDWKWTTAERWGLDPCQGRRWEVVRFWRFQRQNHWDLLTHWIWSVRGKKEIGTEGFGWDLAGWASCYRDGRLWEQQPFNLLPIPAFPQLLSRLVLLWSTTDTSHMYLLGRSNGKGVISYFVL